MKVPVWYPMHFFFLILIVIDLPALRTITVFLKGVRPVVGLKTLSCSSHNRALDLELLVVPVLWATRLKLSRQVVLVVPLFLLILVLQICATLVSEKMTWGAAA